MGIRSEEEDHGGFERSEYQEEEDHDARRPEHGHDHGHKHQFEPVDSPHAAISSPSPSASSMHRTWDQTEDSEPHSETNTIHLSQSEDVERGQSPSSSFTQTVDDLFDHDIHNSSIPVSNRSTPSRVPSTPSNAPRDSNANIHTDAENSPHTNGNINTTKDAAVEVIGNSGMDSSKESSDVKITVSRSIRTSIPAIAGKLKTAAKKNASFAKLSFTSKSSDFKSSKGFKVVKVHQMKIIDVILRFGTLVLSLIAFAVMAATSEVRNGAGSTFNMKFTDYGAYNYLVAVNVIACAYSLCQLFLLARSGIKVDASPSDNNVLFIFIADQVLSFLLFSASTSAATAAQLSRHGLKNIWPPACSTWKLWIFCSKADASVVMSFFASFFVIASALFSGYRLTRSLPPFG